MRLVEADTGDDRSRIERLLRANDLPHDDLDESPVRLFLGYEADEFVGVGGLEPYDDDALLRSVVVPDEVRGQGHGTTLSRALETRAREEGIEKLYLLTTTAEAFFADRGFETIDRSAAPGSIQATAEFSELCSSEATCMRKVVR